MKRLLVFFVMRTLLALRYRIQVKGFENIAAEKLKKPGGILFLANHPAEIDPCILVRVFWPRFRIHPVAVEHLFQNRVVRFVLEFVGSLPIPSFESSSNSYKRFRIEKTYEKIFSLLKGRENVLIYPAGGLKKSGEEVIGGASGVHKILQEYPDVNVVLVRTTGLWGSRFSKALTGKSPNVVEAFYDGIKILLKNFIFFAPRRHVCVECTSVPDDFPRAGDKQTLNRYLENWYNKGGSEPLTLVSYSIFKEVFPKVHKPLEEEELSLEKVPDEIKGQVVDELAQLSGKSKNEIKPEHHLATDLGLDSLDLAQLVVSLKEDFGVSNVHSSELSTVGSVMAFAGRLKKGKYEEESFEKPLEQWNHIEKRPSAAYPEAKTLIEAFLKTCEKMDRSIACTDKISGELTYRRMKLAITILAKKISKFPDKHIGVMLPASAGVNIIIFAVMLAGKIPVMINWTLGARNLRSVIEQSQLHTTISSWNFLDRLENVELDGIDEQIVVIEDLRREITFFDKLVGLIHARKNYEGLLKHFQSYKIDENDPAVILFTSGTESFPKGVPLSHRNIMSNQKDAFNFINLNIQDVMLGILPPFHSFGFTVTSTLPLICGLRVAFSPNPTDGKQIASAIKRWRATLLCIAPSFLKNVFRFADPEHMESLRLVVTGAEKTSSEIFEVMRKLNPNTKVAEGYGITECGPILTINPLDRPQAGVGLPLPHVELKIVHPETYIPLPKGETGLILATGPNIFQGYLNQNLSSPFVEIEGKKWYKTGDLGFLDENGYLILSGRLKRFVKIGGEMVSLGSIEEILLQQAPQEGWGIDPEAPTFAVIALEEGDKKSEIHLFATIQISLDRINQILKEKGMSNLIRIASVEKVIAIPLLGTGKIDYRTLSEKLKGSDDRRL